MAILGFVTLIGIVVWIESVVERIGTIGTVLFVPKTGDGP